MSAIAPDTLEPTMPAACITSYGPTALKVGLISAPNSSTLKPGFVLLRVQCVSIQPSDYKTRDGKLKVLKGIAGQTGAPSAKNPYVLGYDCSGTIEAIGPNVSSNWKVGDQILCVAMAGALATWTTVHESMLARKPESLSFAHAAAYVTAGLTSWQALNYAAEKCGGLKKVFISGGAGGVGNVAIQMAKHVFKAEVVATTASSAKHAFVKECGADIVIDYKSVQDFAAVLGNTYDMAMDCTCEAKKCARTLRPGGQLVCITTDRTDSIPRADMINAMLLGHRQAPLPGCIGGLVNCMSSTSKNRLNLLMLPTGLDQIVRYAAEGTIKLTIDKVFPLDKAPEAFDYVAEGHVTGRVIVECLPS